MKVQKSSKPSKTSTVNKIQRFDPEQAQSALQRYRELLRRANGNIDSQIEQIDISQNADRENVAVEGMRAVEELLKEYGGIVK